MKSVVFPATNLNGNIPKPIKILHLTLQMATESIERSNKDQLLCGLPVSIKDNLCIKVSCNIANFFYHCYVLATTSSRDFVYRDMIRLLVQHLTLVGLSKMTVS